MEPLGFRLLSQDVIFNSSHVEGRDEVGPGQRVGFCGGAEFIGDHGIGTCPFWEFGNDELGPSSHGPPLWGGPGSIRFFCFCALRGGVIDEVPPRTADRHGHVGFISSCLGTEVGGKVVISPFRGLVVGMLRPWKGAEGPADANIVWLRTLQGKLWRFDVNVWEAFTTLPKNSGIDSFFRSTGRRVMADANIVWLRTPWGRSQGFLGTVLPCRDLGSFRGNGLRETWFVKDGNNWGRVDAWFCSKFYNGPRRFPGGYLGTGNGAVRVGAPRLRGGAPRDQANLVHFRGLGAFPSTFLGNIPRAVSWILVYDDGGGRPPLVGEGLDCWLLWRLEKGRLQGWART